MYRTISFCGETRRCGMNEEVRDDGVAAGETPAGGVNILL
jgi:hypothetical protein